ncbi:hypothetical protein ACVXG7_26885 [Enterobacter hormaechei]
MLNKPPLPFTKGLRLGNMPQIRTIVDEELESVWTGKKRHSRRWIPPESAGISCCAALSSRRSLNLFALTNPLPSGEGQGKGKHNLS